MSDAMNDKPVSATLVGRAFYVFNRKPQHDKDNDKYLYKLELALTNADGTPIIKKNKKTGKEINMLERAKELGLIVKEPKGQIEGTHVRLKREVKKLKDGSDTLPPETKLPGGEDFNEIIGNESEVQVEFAAIPIRKGKYAGKNTMGYLNKIVVLKHVPYITGLDEEYEFETEAPTSKASAKKVKVDEDAELGFEDLED